MEARQYRIFSCQHNFYLISSLFLKKQVELSLLVILPYIIFICQYARLFDAKKGRLMRVFLNGEHAGELQPRGYVN